MASWKQVLLKALGLGVGIGVGLAISVAFYGWYVSRPVPEKPWDANAITASFRSADTAGKDNHLRFGYILENHTDSDYRVKTSELLLSAVVQDKDSLAEGGDVKFQDDNVFLPAKQHAEVEVELLDYYFTGDRHPNDTPEERRKYKEGVKKYLNDSLPRLNGFAAFDDAKRYRINFPNGWTPNP
jgi:hypothetical protein